MGVPGDQNHPDREWEWRDSSLEPDGDGVIPDAYVCLTLSPVSFYRGMFSGLAEAKKVNF
jgi:hypothetical protein